MPGIHSRKTKLLGFYADREVVRRIDEARSVTSRSDFLRDALIEHLRGLGIRVPDRLRRPADRTALSSS